MAHGYPKKHQCTNVICTERTVLRFLTQCNYTSDFSKPPRVTSFPFILLVRSPFPVDQLERSHFFPLKIKKDQGRVFAAASTFGYLIGAKRIFWANKSLPLTFAGVQRRAGLHPLCSPAAKSCFPPSPGRPIPQVNSRQMRPLPSQHLFLAVNSVR
ncbi:hypothetical protein VTK26DRAFT_5589 [Humicola hyalothermophila]